LEPCELGRHDSGQGPACGREPAGVEAGSGVRHRPGRQQPGRDVQAARPIDRRPRALRRHPHAGREQPAKILDTRKTTPGLRALEKAAVVAGGGVNHRSGLYDMVLVKDNHLAALGGLSGFADQIRRLRKERPNIRIEVEADDLEQVRAFVEIDGIDAILLDNMVPAQIREALALRRNNIKFEASGGITLKTVRRIAATGVDFISIGALTNAARAIDLGLEMTHVHG